MNSIIREEDEFSEKERLEFAKYLPPMNRQEEDEVSNTKTSKFTTDEPSEEFHINVNNEDVLGFVQQKNTIDFVAEFDQYIKYIYMWRRMALHPIADDCLDHICDEAMNFNNSPDLEPMKLLMNSSKLSEMGISENTQKSILECYNEILMYLDFRKKGWGIFKDWYVDGRLYVELVYNKGEKDLKTVNIIPPENIVLIRIYKRDANGDKNYQDYEEFYVYDSTPEKEKLQRFRDGEFNNADLYGMQYVNYSYNSPEYYTNTPLKIIPKKYVLFIESGLKDSISRMQLSRKYLNQLVLLQDSMVVYRISRASEKRMIYVDVPEYIKPADVKRTVNLVRNEFKQDLAYDRVTGMILNDRHIAAVTEDNFIPRYGGQKSAEVDVLPGGDNLGQISDVEYQLKETVRSFKVPLSRFFDDQTLVNLSSDYNASNDEITYQKYIKRLRDLSINSMIFDLLRIKLIGRNIVSNPSEFYYIRQYMSIEYVDENFYSEIKRMELENSQLSMFQNFMLEVNNGNLSRDFAYRKSFGMTSHEIDTIDSEIIEDSKKLSDRDEKRHEYLMKSAQLQAELELEGSAQLQIELRDIEGRIDHTAEKYGNDHGPGSGNG